MDDGRVHRRKQSASSLGTAHVATPTSYSCSYARLPLLAASSNRVDCSTGFYIDNHTDILFIRVILYSFVEG